MRDRHTLWFDDAERGRRGVRVSPEQATLLRSVLEDGDALVLDIAPTVAGSSVPWVRCVRRGGETLLDDSARLRWGTGRQTCTRGSLPAVEVRACDAVRSFSTTDR